MNITWDEQYFRYSVLHCFQLKAEVAAMTIVNPCLNLNGVCIFSLLFFIEVTTEKEFKWAQSFSSLRTGSERNLIVFSL